MDILLHSRYTHCKLVHTTTTIDGKISPESKRELRLAIRKEDPEISKIKERYQAIKSLVQVFSRFFYVCLSSPLMGRDFFQILPSELTTNILSRVPIPNHCNQQMRLQIMAQSARFRLLQNKNPSRLSLLEGERFSLNDFRT